MPPLFYDYYIMTNTIGESYFKDMKLKAKYDALPNCNICNKKITGFKYNVTDENNKKIENLYTCTGCYVDVLPF